MLDVEGLVFQLSELSLQLDVIFLAPKVMLEAVPV
jgi:hypothetical protein